MKVLIIGLGSIARKHLWALKQLVPAIGVFALRSDKMGSNEKGVHNIFTYGDVPIDIDFIIISNPTSEHHETIERCIAFGVPLFIEKPPLMQLDGSKELLDKIKEKGTQTYTAFNFRFHPLLNWLKNNLNDKRVIEVQSYCGSYLPNWRPGRDYRKVYSAISRLGGGVHLDLIHELDYINWLFGTPKSIQSTIAKNSDLEIETPDVAHYSLAYDNLFASILLNYYRKDSKRTIEIVMYDDTWCANLLTGTISNSKDEIVFKDQTPVKETYLAQMKYFIQNLKSDHDYMNNLSESVKILAMCQK